jgi:hypothetical protein
MSDLSIIREEVKTVLEAGISGLRVYPYEPDGYMEYPCVIVAPTEDIEYANRAINSENIRIDFSLVLYLAINSSTDGWKELDEYRSPTGAKSIRKAIKDNATLNSKVGHAEVTRSGEASRGRDVNDRFWEFSCSFGMYVLKNF